MTRTRRIRLDTKRRVTGAVFALALVVAVLIPFAVWRGARAIIKSNEGQTVTSTDQPTAEIPATPVGLIIRTGPDGHARGMVLISALPNKVGGYVIQVPLDTRVDIVDHGADRLAIAFDLGGAALAKQTLEAFLQVAIESVVVLDPSALITALQPYQPFRFTLSEPILNHRADGRTDTVLPVGDVVLDALDVPRVLDARLDRQTELDVLPRQEILWRAIASAVKSKTPVAGSPDTAAAWIATLGNGDHEVSTLALDNTPDGQPGVKADIARARLLAAQAMPGAVSPLTDGKRYRIINTTTDPLVALAAVRRVLASGGSVIAEGDASPIAATTVFEYADDSQAQFAADLVKSYTVGTTRRAAQKIEGIDVTMTLGKDFASVVAAETPSSTTQALVPTTSTTKG